MKYALNKALFFILIKDKREKFKMILRIIFVIFFIGLSADLIANQSLYQVLFFALSKLNFVAGLEVCGNEMNPDPYPKRKNSS
jgi:hypothetical protein